MGKAADKPFSSCSLNVALRTRQIALVIAWMSVAGTVLVKVAAGHCDVL